MSVVVGVRAAPGGGPLTEREWRSLAACRDVDPEWFFPTAEAGAGERYEDEVARAKSVCAGCRVRAECLEFTLAHSPYGIGGGLTEDERRGLGKGRAAAAGGVPAAAVAGDPGQIVDDGCRVGATRAERLAAVAVLVTTGLSRAAIGARVGVSARTVVRWQRELVAVEREVAA